MCAGEDLDRLASGLSPATGRWLCGRAHQVGQQLRVAGIRLRARDMVAVTVAGHRQRIDPEHLIAGRDQRLDPQTAVGSMPTTTWSGASAWLAISS